MRRSIPRAFVLLLTAALLAGCDESPPACRESDLAAAPAPQIAVCVELEAAWAAETHAGPPIGGKEAWSFEAKIGEKLDASASSSCAQNIGDVPGNRVDWLRITDAGGRKGVVVLSVPEGAASPTAGDTLGVAYDSSGGWNYRRRQTVLLNGKLFTYSARAQSEPYDSGAGGLTIAQHDVVCAGMESCGSWNVLSASVQYQGASAILTPGSSSDLGPLHVHLQTFSETTSRGACQDWDATTFALSAYLRSTQ